MNNNGHCCLLGARILADHPELDCDSLYDAYTTKDWYAVYDNDPFLKSIARKIRPEYEELSIRPSTIVYNYNDNQKNAFPIISLLNELDHESDLP